jgi:hypothetical protein
MCRLRYILRFVGCLHTLIAMMALLVPAIFAAPPDRRPAVSLHPANPKYFLFRGRPLVLVAATEHYGSVINRAFDFEKYLDDATDKKMTLTRTFLLFRELQTARNPFSPCKPESPDFIAPYLRTGPGKALDGEPIYDLDQWNPEYFSRLHRFLRAASDRGIVVELTLFSNTYTDSVWALNPLRSQNNKQKIGKVEWPDYTSLKDKALVERQLLYARKIIQETSPYDNVYYEICNEAGGRVANHASPADVDAWQAEVARVVREELQRRDASHLIFGLEAFRYTPRFEQGFDASFTGTTFDAVNCHPLPGLTLGSRHYELGHFMSKELKLKAVQDYCLAAFLQRKPLVLDEDNTASLYRDPVGWTIHRKRAWTAVLCGAHYDYIDFSVTVGSEAGTPQSRKGIRSWMKHLSGFIHSLDIVSARPGTAWIIRKPEHLIVSGLAVEGKEYVAYLADDREVTDPEAGKPIEGSLSFSLPPGRYQLSLYSPATGSNSAAVLVDGKEAVNFRLAPFEQDIVIRVSRNSGSAEH